jgi:hypothetical protein
VTEKKSDERGTAKDLPAEQTPASINEPPGSNTSPYTAAKSPDKPPLRKTP